MYSPSYTICISSGQIKICFFFHHLLHHGHFILYNWVTAPCPSLINANIFYGLPASDTSFDLFSPLDDFISSHCELDSAQLWVSHLHLLFWLSSRLSVFLLSNIKCTVHLSSVVRVLVVVVIAMSPVNTFYELDMPSWRRFESSILAFVAATFACRVLPTESASLNSFLICFRSF